MNGGSEFELLLAYLNDELDNNEVAALAERLQREPALAEHLVEIACEEGKIVEWAGASAWSAACPKNSSPACVLPEPLSPAPAFPLVSFLWTALLVAIVGGAIVGGLSLYRSRDPRDRHAVEPPKQAFDVRLARTIDCRWADDHPAVSEGDELSFGAAWTLLDGVAEIEYSNGVRVVLHGPSTFTAVSADRGLLDVGRLSATVPRTATGYTIQTPSLAVVDRGTQFGLRIADDGSTEVHVFQGEVEAVTRREDGLPRVRQTLSTAQAARFNLRGHLDGWLQPDVQSFKGVEQRTLGVVSTDRAMRWLATPPPSLEEGQLQSANDMFLFLERENVVLPRDVEITTAQRRGTQARFSVERATLPAGTRVDSYLLHFDPGTSTESRHGGVHFTRPVLGLIARGDQLRASDDLFAAPGTRYVFRNPAESGLDDAHDGEYPDVVQYRQATGQVFVLKSQHPGTIDQVRILIATEEPSP